MTDERVSLITKDNGVIFDMLKEADDSLDLGCYVAARVMEDANEKSYTTTLHPSTAAAISGTESSLQQKQNNHYDDPFTVEWPTDHGKDWPAEERPTDRGKDWPAEEWPADHGKDWPAVK